MAPQDQGRRRFPRYRTDMKVTVLVLGPEGHVTVNGLCKQIGEDGLGAIIANELSIGEMVDLQLSMSLEPTPVSLRALVRWHNRLQHGFEFFGISSEQRAMIRDYCKDHLTEQNRI